MRLHPLKMSVFFGLPLKNRVISLALMILFSTMGMEVSAATYYSRATGNWIGGTVWSTTPTGTASVATILSTDDVVIQAGNTITVNGAATCASLTFNTLASTSGVTISGTNSLTVSGAVTMNAKTGATTTTLAVGTGTLSAGSITISGANTATWINTITISTGSLTCDGDFIFNSGSQAASAVFGITNSGAIITINGNISTTAATNGRLTLANPTNISLGGNYTFSGTLSSTTRLRLTLNGTIDQTVNGTNTFSSLIVDKVSGVASIGKATSATTFTLTNGIFDPASFLLTSTTGNFTAGTLRVGAATWGGNYSIAITEPLAGTIEYDANGAQTVNNVSYGGNLAILGSGTKTWTITNNRTIGGSLTVGAGSELATSGNFTIGVSGNTSLDGTLTLGGTAAKTFTGNVTVNAGGIWNETGAAAINFAGDLTNNASSPTDFTANSGTHTFTGASHIISGVQETIIPKVAITGTYQNNSTLTINTALSGSGSLTQGPNSTLNIGGPTTTAITITNFDASSNTPNTVNYTNAGAQTLDNVNYYNLGLSGGGIKTLNSAITAVNGTFTVGGNASATALVGMSFGNVVLNSGTFVGGAFTHTVSGNWTDNGGTFTNTGTTINLNGTTQVIGGTSSSAFDILAINSGVNVNLSTGLSHTTNTLSLNGAGVIDGTWGSSSSAATYQNDTYFAATNGIVTVSTSSCTGPTAYSVTGGGAYCTGGSGVAVGLSNSQSGVNYQLLLGGNPDGATVPGTGGAISFGIKTAVGTYTVRATQPVTHCTAVMNGNAVVTINSLPTVSITGSNSICIGSTTTLSPTTGGTWVSSDGGLASVTNAGVVTGAAAGSPTFTFTATATGCSSTTAAVTVNPILPASISISASSNLICSGTNVTFTATPTNGGTTPVYQWKLNGGNVGTNSTTYTNAALANNDVVTCVMTSNATPCLTGSPATSNTVTITILAGGTWTGAIDTDWNNAGNWSCGSIPTALTDVTIPNVTNKPVIGAAALCRDITINAGSSLTITGSNALTVSGNWTNNGTFTANSSTVNFNGGGQTITGTSVFNNVIVSGNGAKTITTANFTVGGILSMEETGTLSAAPTYGASATLQYNTVTARTSGAEWLNSFVATGGVVISNTGAITANAAKVFNTSVKLTVNAAAALNMANLLLTLGGDLINNNGTITGSGGVTINGNGTQSIGSFTNTGTVSMLKGGGTATLTDNINGGALTINGTGGTLNLGTGLTHTISGIWTRTAGTLNGGSSLLNIGGNVSGTGGTFTANAGTVNYTGAAQTAAVVTYNNLTVSGSLAKTFATNPTVNGILSLEGTASVVVTAGTGVVTYGTNATLQYNKPGAYTATTEEWLGTFAATGGVIIANTGAITMGGAKIFNAGIPLTINAGATLTPGANLLTLGGDFHNSGTLTSGSGGVTITGAAATQSIDGFTTTGALTFSKTTGTATLMGNVNSASLTIPTTASSSTLAINPSVTVAVSGALTFNLPATAAVTIAIGDGSLSCASISLAGATGGVRTTTLSIATGTLNVAGNITSAGVDSKITVTGAGTINAGGTFLSGTIGTFTAGTGTVNYNSASAQTIGAYTYNNVILSGGGSKTFTATTTINGNLSIATGTNNNVLGAGLSHPANSLTLGGIGQVAGTWGGTGSGATNINSTYFTATTGKINVSTVSYSPPTAISATPSQINFGDAGTISLAASGGGGGGATLTWYAGGCGSGTAIGTGSPVSVNKPSITTTYYARWENGGNYSTCLSTTVTVVTTLYSYQSGDWNTANSWTTDPSGTSRVNPAVPSPLDNVVILNGRSITVAQNSKSVNSLEIRLGGTLDLVATTGHNFGTVTGQGVLRLSSNVFPGGTYSGFVASSGGTVEYYDITGQSISNTQLTYNKLIISNYSSSANSVFIDNNVNNITYTVNGSFDLRNYGAGSLTFSFGNPVASDNLINMTVSGNFTVAAGCYIRVNNFATAHTLASSDAAGVANPIHSLYLYGDLLNNGSIRFTGLPSPINSTYYTLATTAFGSNYGDVQVFFEGASNNAVTCNGTTDFFRLIVEKGSDQTYTLDVTSSGTGNFGLYGPNNQGNSNFAGLGYLYKALFIHYGTLKLSSNIDIPSITEGGQDFVLLPTACLWVNGANVSSTVSGINGTSYQAATFYGNLRISAGQFSTADAAGIVLGNLGIPEINIEGTGTLDVSQVWNNAGATNLISYIQSGGTANFRLLGENHASSMFTLDNINTVFNMSGGTINFINNTFSDGNTNYQILNIQVQAGNYSVTGGTINLNLPSSATVYTANSTVPFYNVNISRRTGVGNVSVQWNTPGSSLSILNDLSIGSNTSLDLNTSSIDLKVGRNFTLAAAGTYTPGNNTTTLNGNAGQTFTNAGTITSGLNNFTLANASNTSITNDLTVRGNLIIGSGCFLDDQGYTISVAGNVTNSGTHTSQANGSILLNGSATQTIGGSGSGVFGNLALNKSSGAASFTSNQSINGNLRLANGILDINLYNLKFSTTSAVYDVLSGAPAPTTFGDTRMIMTSGEVSDGGVTRTFSATGTFLYPLGTSSGYHPATIDFSQAPTHWGDITVKPVAKIHPSVTGTDALKYYWKVISSSITGIQPGSVSKIFQYITSDPGPSIDTYITGIYNPFAWVKGANLQVDKINKKIYFPAIQVVDGEYTAGVSSSFGDVKVYYSRQTGDWADINTWSTISNTGAVAGTLPTIADLVVIGDGGSNNHTVTISSGSKSVSGLQLSYGSTLDLQTNTGHVFGSVTDAPSGFGTLRISSAAASAAFPSGDFGDFLGATGGTVDYYTATGSSVAFTMPTQYLVDSNPITITGYYNLILSPAAGKKVTMPNTDLLVYKDINVTGASGTDIAQFNNLGVSRTLTVNGNLIVNSGNLQYTNGASTSQNVVVVGNVTVATGAIFNVAANLAATNTLSIQGNLTNNGTFNMLAGASQVCNVTFTGAANTQINGSTTGGTNFNVLTINKGTDRTSILESTVNMLNLNTGLAAAMVLNNGTFKLSNSSVNITLSTTSPFTIPTTGCISANLGTINIGTANNNNADLLLHGRLEVINAGIVKIGSGLGSNNDLEYSASGFPELVVSGGTLTVDGQIRRNTSNTLGSLIFTQSGGTITVKGKAFDNTRGMFEVLNTGSQFNITGGSLIIENAGSVTFADVFLEPGSYTVNNNNSGHTLTFGNTSTPAAQTFKLNSTAPVWNLTVDGTTNSKTVSLAVNALTILKDLTINGTGGIFKANELAVTIGGSLVNNNTSSGTGANVGGYQAGAAGSAQNTTFNGTGSITGTNSNLTNFANLIIGSLTTTPSITLATNSNIRVNNALTLTSGTLADAGNTITAMGNITTSATHSSPLSSVAGGILMANTSKQVITSTGSGNLGRLTVNNAAGVDVIGNMTITGQLTLTSGLLYINDYKLTMDVNSSFGGTFDVNRMVVMNGVVSDKGVQKNFAGTASNFVFPVGSSGKYRPATFSFTTANSGSITITPVNQAHPADDASSTTDQLNYYWKMTLVGLSGATAITQLYQYGLAEVTGTESSYIAARFSNSAWTPYTTAEINATNHTITINDLFSGEYTAGQSVNFGIIPKLYSIKSGNWNDGTVWAQDSPLNSTCNCFPNGNPVYIMPGHTVTMNIDGASATSVDIKGIFDLKQSAYHSLGAITDEAGTGKGGGKLRVEGTPAGMFLFAAGNYDLFMESSGTTVELYGSIDSRMPLNPGNITKPYQNLILSGTGVKKMSAETLKILGNLTISAGTKLNDVDFNKELYILGNWTDQNTTPATGGFVAGLGLVSFEGSNPQTLTTNSGVTENFYDFQINNAAGVTISGKAQINNTLNLINGAITTTSSNTLTIANASPTAVTGGSVSSYVNGPLRKQISNGSYFTYPVGKKSPSPRYGQVYLAGVVTAGIWEAEYYNGSPEPPYTRSSMLSPIVSVSDNEYWRINGVTSGSANVTLRWDAGSLLPTDHSKTRVTEWNSTRWENRGNSVVDNGTTGTVTTDSPISLASDHILTIGSGSLPLPTATISSLSPSAICNNGIASTTLTIALTGVAPWSLTYKVGTVSTTLNNIASSPVTIALNSNSSGITQPIVSGTPFNINVTYINDANGTAGTPDPTTFVLTVNPNPDNSISGRNLVATNESTSYTTPADAASYSWTLPAGGTLTNATSNTCTVQWAGVAGTHTLSLSKTSSAGCTVTNSLSVTISTLPTPNITGNQKACAHSVETYSTPNNTLHSYTWGVTANGTITSGAGTNSIQITWNGTVSNNNVVSLREYVTATPSIFTDVTKIVDIGIQPTDIPQFTAPSDSVCTGNPANFVVLLSEANVRYQLRDINGVNSGPFVDGTGANISLIGDQMLAETTYKIYAYTLAPFNCYAWLKTPSLTTTVKVKPKGQWYGKTSSDWNTGVNWSCGVPDLTTNVLVADKKSPAPYYFPTVAVASTGTVKDLTIQPGATVTVNGALQIAGTIYNTGALTATNGTIEMKGSASQSIPSGTFTANKINNLTINNSAGVTLGGALDITGIVTATLGTFATNNNLTLISNSSQTALISGSGSGSVTGNVTMQRYLGSGLLGYKYLSTPLGGISDTHYSSYLSSTPGNFPKFYSYNENPAVDKSGWTVFSGALSPMVGYAVNMGTRGATTISLTGTANTGTYSASLQNNNKTYTQGFNLVGNPYPSPIDWKAATGWTKTNIDDAIYFFNASGDEYSGEYSSVLGGIASGNASNIIPSMQGFFVHVTSGSYPVNATLGMTNSVRTNDLNPSFKAAVIDPRTILRFAATFDESAARPDNFVLYFDPIASLQFDKNADALKLMNTNMFMPNLYGITTDAKQVQISGIPQPTDSLTIVPVGLTTLKDGWINFSATDISKLPTTMNVYINDKELKTTQDLRKLPAYRFYLKKGEYNQRFEILFAKSGKIVGSTNTSLSEKLFAISQLNGAVIVKVNIPDNESAKLYVSNMLGQVILEKEVTHLQIVDISIGVQSGVYVVTMTTGTRSQSEKTLIRKK